jgi:hypothetical protein
VPSPSPRGPGLFNFGNPPALTFDFGEHALSRASKHSQHFDSFGSPPWMCYYGLGGHCWEYRTLVYVAPQRTHNTLTPSGVRRGCVTLNRGTRGVVRRPKSAGSDLSRNIVSRRSPSLTWGACTRACFKRTHNTLTLSGVRRGCVTTERGHYGEYYTLTLCLNNAPAPL